MMKRIFYHSILAYVTVLGGLLHTGCDNLFKDSPVDRITENDIWSNPMLLDEYGLTWYRNMNSGFSIYVPTTIALVKSASRYYMPWFADQVVPSKTDYYNAGYGDLLKGNLQEITRWAQVRWSGYYTEIQSVNRLLEHSGDIADGTQKERILGEAYFFRAYYYYMLWRQYGGVLLIKQTYDPLNDGLKFPRATYSQMVESIVADAREAARRLPLEHDNINKGRVTRGAALALIAKTYLWAASPVYQQAEQEYLGFATDRTEEMLKLAQQAYNDFFDLQQYSLIQLQGTTEDEIKKAYRNIFLTKNSQESILEVQHSDDGNYDTGFGHKLDREAAAPHFTGTTAAYTPTQNHVDEYGMRQGFTYNAQDPYVGRDYRFYANILYDGSTYNGHVMDIHYTKAGSTETAGEDLTPYGTSATAAVTRTGYYMGKFVNEQQQIDNNETYASSQNYIIWRYAEMLLDYAEVAYRLNDPEAARSKVNEVRRRAHMHELPTISWEEITHERRVELAFEESTYWDVLRYGEAEERFNGATNPLKAMKVLKRTVNGSEVTTYTISNMNRFPQRVRVFQHMQYYLPIPWDEVRYHGVPQNPEWTEV